MLQIITPPTKLMIMSFITIFFFFDEESGFPSIREAIKVDKNLHVQLQLCSKPVPHPSWFITGRNGTLTRYSMLENFPSYFAGYSESENKIIAEMNNMIPPKVAHPILLI